MRRRLDGSDTHHFQLAGLRRCLRKALSAEAWEVLLSGPERRILGSVDDPLAFIVADLGPGSDGTPVPELRAGKVRFYPGARIELLALRAFQARATKFVSNPPPLGETLEWLAMMRHWGDVHPALMDVTTSPHVALYFAVCEHLAPSTTPRTTDSAVWAVNHVPLRHAASKAVGLPDHTDLSDARLFREHVIYSRAAHACAGPSPEPQRASCCSAGNISLHRRPRSIAFGESPRACMPGTEVKDQGVLHKFIIDHRAAPEILGRLTTMNIHRASLFPDLQGYAQFIEDSLAIFGMRGSYYNPNVDFESLERLGWLG